MGIGMGLQLIGWRSPCFHGLIQACPLPFPTRSGTDSFLKLDSARQRPDLFSIMTHFWVAPELLVVPQPKPAQSFIFSTTIFSTAGAGRSFISALRLLQLSSSASAALACGPSKACLCSVLPAWPSFWWPNRMWVMAH